MNHLRNFVLEELAGEPELTHLEFTFDVDGDEWISFIDFLKVELEEDVQFELKDESNERGRYRELYSSSNVRIARYYPSDSTVEAIFNWESMKKVIDGDAKLAKKLLK